MKKTRLDVAKEDLQLFIAALALGLLEGIKSKSLLHEIGTWSLARPRFLTPILRDESISAELKNILKQFDELNLLNELDPQACKKVIDEMILQLKEILLTSSEDSCRIDFQ